MEYHHHQPSAISRKLSNSGGVTGNHVYDGVFGRPEKLGSRTAAEDYREIFSGSSSCSIPMLDVPELNEGKICVDARSSRLDYNKIFGGFGDDDFGVSHEELFKRPKEGRSNTSRQVRSSAESRQRSRRSGHSNIPEDAKQLTPEVPLQFDGVKQFNVSYNRSNSGVGSGTNGTMRIAQLGATPGYTCVVDEVSSTTQMLDGGKLVRSGLNDSHPSVNISESVEGGKPQRKVVSGPQPSEVLKTSSTKVNVTERGEGGNLQRKVVYGPQPSQVLKTSSTRVNVNEGTEGGNLRRKFVSGPQPSEFMKTSYTKVNISEQVVGGNLQTKVVSGPQPTEVSNTSSTKVNISERVGGGDLQRKVVSGPQPSEFLKTSSPKVNVSERVEGGNLQRKVVSGHQPSEVSKTSYAKVNVERVGGNLQRKVVSGPQPSELLKTSDTKANASERIGGNLQRKVVSGPQSSEVLKISSPNCTDIKRRVSRHRSISDDLPLEEFELGVEPHPTRKSLHSRNMSGSSLNAGVSHRFMYSDVGIYRMDDHEGAPGSCSPPLFEEDGDVNSTAASSAAAVRKAIEEAQAKIKLAKELMEKRKGFRNRVKVGFSNGLKADRREDISAEMSYGFNDEPRETLARKGFSESFIYHTSQNIAIKNNQETPNFQGKENSLHATHRGLETCKPEPKSAQVDLEVEESMDGNREPLPEHAVPEGERASELEFMLAAHKMNSKSSSKEHSGEEDMRAAEISERPKDYGGELTTPRETLKEGKIEKVLNTVAGAFEWVVYKFNSPSSHEHHYRSEHEDTGRLSPEPEQAYQTTTELEKQKKARKELMKPADENAILVKGSKESMDDNVILNECGNLLEKGMKQEDINVQAEMQDNLEGFNIDDTDGGVDENGEQPDNKMGHRETSEAVKYVKEEVEREQEDDDEKECEQLEINDTNKLGEVLSQEVLNLVGNVHLEKEESMVVLTDCDNTEEKERHKKLVVDSSKCEEIPFNSDKEKILDEIQCPRENETVCDKANGSVECPNKQEPDSVECSDEQKPNQFCVENNKKDTVVLREEDFKNFGECSEEVTDGSFDDTLYINEPNIRYVKNDVIVGQGGLDENDKLLEEFSHMNDTEARLEKTCERTESEEQSGIHQETEDGLNEASQQSFGSPSEVFKARPDECEVDSNDNLGRIGGIHEHRETLEKVEITVKDLLDEENERTVEETENSYLPKEFMRVPDTVGEANEMEEENCEVAGFMGINEMQNSVNVSDDLVSGKKGADLKFEGNVIEFISIEEKHTKEIHCSLDKNEDVKTIAIGFESEGTNYDDHLVSPQRELLSENESDSTSVEEICKVGSRSKEVEKPEVLDNHGDNEDSCETSQKESGVDDTTDAVVSQKFHLFENNEKTNAIVQEKTTAQITNEKEENHHETLTIERKADDTLQKESDLERKQRREKEEAKAREMEKEKERIAVERAIREARERAFAEARERAEKAAVARAAVEAQQRLKAETQKRLEKVSSGLNDKSSSEKAAIANKLKAERAAVERATAEARERALERAMSEKKQRNQGEKVTGVSGDNISRSNDKQSRDSCRSSSNNDAPCSTETFANANGESGIRCKATMERLQRTAERAAKALAEKNKRDLLVQKEQEERNRLAEVLDAEVKRWSSGKERNLRALLSTLQYILGPDSGWQAISLTELISSAAVKKAYRKATLFVHPDKLQQRGASIQQKYTCEKVFDLLKEAWNKFSAEER